MVRLVSIGKTIHTFTQPGTLLLLILWRPNDGGLCEYLAIGGGGEVLTSGRWRWCWCRNVPGSTPISRTFSHSITIGAGGPNAYLGNDPGTKG